MKKKNGFTLIEMLIVIAILAILYSISAANVTGMQTEAKMSKANGDLKTLKLALDSFFKNNNIYPTEANYQRTLIQERPSILTGNLMDPFGNTVNTMYSYEISYDMQNYVVYSVGPRRNGEATIGEDGHVTIKEDPIIATNGYR